LEHAPGVARDRSHFTRTQAERRGFEEPVVFESGFGDVDQLRLTLGHEELRVAAQPRLALRRQTLDQIHAVADQDETHLASAQPEGQVDQRVEHVDLLGLQDVGFVHNHKQVVGLPLLFVEDYVAIEVVFQVVNQLFVCIGFHCFDPKYFHEQRTEQVFRGV